MKLKGDELEEYVKNNTKKIIKIWKNFNIGVLWLNQINFKFGTNNCLEDYNKQLKKSLKNKKSINIIIFINTSIDEVIDHEEILVSENKATLKSVSKKRLKGK